KVAWTPFHEARENERDGEDPEHDSECAADLAGEVKHGDGKCEESANHAVGGTHVLRHRIAPVEDSARALRSAKMLDEQNDSQNRGETEETATTSFATL